MLIASAVMCLALNIYHEARGESIVGQHAVAQVTLNRADRDPSKVCQVVAAKKQFSWTNESFGLVKNNDGKRIVLTEKGEPKDDIAWDRAKKIARATLSRADQPDCFARGATFYHTLKVRPIWRHSLKQVAVIGRHKFYTS